MKYQIKHEMIACKHCGNDARLNFNGNYAWASCKGCAETGQRVSALLNYDFDDVEEFMEGNGGLNPSEVAAVGRWNAENERSGK